MKKAANATSKLGSLSVIILMCIIIITTLPLKFTLQQHAISLLGGLSLVMAVFALSNVINGNNKAIYKSKITDAGMIRNDITGYLLLAILAYIVIQLIPFPKSLVEIIAPSMAVLWQVDAYGLSNKAVLTANISGTIWFLITWSGYFILFVLLSRQISRNWHFVLVTSTLFLIGLFQIVFDEVTKYLGYEYITAGQTDGHSYRLTGTFVNSNNVSALINLSIAAGFALLVYLKNSPIRINTVNLVIAFGLIGLGEIVLFYGLIKAGSAGGFLSLISSVLLVSTMLILRKFSIKVITGLCLFVGILLVILTFYGSRELNLIELRDNLSLSGRPILWQSVIEMWGDFPLFGIGAGAFEWAYPMYKSDAVTPLRVFTAHSGYLHLAVETGLIGVVLGAGLGINFLYEYSCDIE